MTGEWVWSEEEEEQPAVEAPESDEEPSYTDDKRPMNQLQKADSSGSDNEAEVSLEKILFTETWEFIVQ